jgi:hypothetical protein
MKPCLEGTETDDSNCLRAIAETQVRCLFEGFGIGDGATEVYWI